MKNLTLCLLMHVFGKSTILCRCPFNEESNEKKEAAINIHFTHIEQNGNANIAGNGTATYEKGRAKFAKLKHLKEENRLLSELIKMMQNRDK